MSTKNPKTIQPGGGFFQDISTRIKLILRLMGDSRVNPVYKVLPVASIVYLVFPDLVPTPIDDALLIWLGTYLFVELCPPEVVQEHMEALQKVIPGQWQNPTSEDTVDAEFRETTRSE